MFSKNIKSFILILSIVVSCFFLHQLLFAFLNIEDSEFVFTIVQLYFFFGFFALLTEVILQKIKQKNIDLVGNVFLGLTLTKMMFCFVIGNYISDKLIERNNFLALFFIFLFIETVSAIKLLNSKNS